MIADYAYEQYFTMDNIRKDILIVEEGATLTVEDDKSITVGNTTFTIKTEDLVSEKFELSKSLCSDNTITYGKCNASACKFTIGNMSIPDLTNKYIAVYLYFNRDGDTLFEVGHFRVSDDTYSDSRRQRNIVSQDLLYYIKSLDVTAFYNSSGMFGTEDRKIPLLNIVSATLSYCKSRYSLPTSLTFDTSALVTNTQILITKTIDKDLITAGEILERALELMCAFGHINNENKLILAPIRNTKNLTNPTEIPKSQIKPPVKYQDYNTPVISNVRYFSGAKEISKSGNASAEGTIEYIVKNNPFLADRNLEDGSDILAITSAMWSGMQYHIYLPLEVTCQSNLCRELGDVYTVEGISGAGGGRVTYILNITTKGIQQMFDTYSAKYVSKNNSVNGISNSYSGFSSDTSESKSKSQGGIGDYNDTNLPELMRNFGYRLLDEPSDVSCVLNESDNSVTLKWTDPDDLTDDKPIPAYWKGTVVVRKEGSAPLNIYDGTIVVETTLADGERDIYSENGYVDSGLESNIKYFYGIFPYTDDGIEKDYRWTKVVTANTNILIDAPKITSATPDGRTVTVNYHLPTGTYSSRKIVYKANDIPKSATDGQSYNIGAGQSGDNHSTITNLQPTTTYYFVIFDTDSNGRTATSNAVSCTTGTVSTTVLFDVHDSDTFVSACTQSPSTSGAGIHLGWDSANGRTRISGSTSGSKYWESPAPYNVAMQIPNANVYIEFEGMAEQYDGFPMGFHWIPLHIYPNGYSYDSQHRTKNIVVNDNSDREVPIDGGAWLDGAYNVWHRFKVEFKVVNGLYSGNIKMYVDGNLVINSSAANGFKAPKPFGAGINQDNYFVISHAYTHHMRNIKMWYEA